MTVNLLKTDQTLIPVGTSALTINTQEVTTDVGAWALHFGIHASLSEDLRRVLHLMFPKGWAICHGDGWNCWGEDVGTDVNDADTVHVFVYYNGDLSDAISAVVRLHEANVPLVPIAEQGSDVFNGTVASLTDAEDWADEIAHWWLNADGALVGKIG